METLDRISGAIRRRLPLRWQLTVRKLKNRGTWRGTSLADPLKLIWVRPQDIRYSVKAFDRMAYMGRILDGDWDLKISAVDEKPIYGGLRERYVDGRDWEETAYYRIFAERFSQRPGMPVWGYSSIQEFEQRLVFLDRLYRSILDQGYRTQLECGPAAQDPVRHGSERDAHLRTHEVGCNIGRAGAFLLNSGIHRLAIAQILGLERFPIQVVVRHAEWQKLRESISPRDDLDPVPRSGDIALHPDLQDLCKE